MPMMTAVGPEIAIKPTLDPPRSDLAKSDLAKSDLATSDHVTSDLATSAPPLYDLIELMFFAYRDFVQDADRILAADGFGRAHHRVLYFVVRRPGLTIAELLDILKITKQSLNRVLKDLLERGYVSNRSGETDRRQRLLYPTAYGDALVRDIAAVQSARFERVLGRLGASAKPAAIAFLHAMIDAPEADGLDLASSPARISLALPS